MSDPDHDYDYRYKDDLQDDCEWDCDCHPHRKYWIAAVLLILLAVAAIIVNS